MISLRCSPPTFTQVFNLCRCSTVRRRRYCSYQILNADIQLDKGVRFILFKKPNYQKSEACKSRVHVTHATSPKREFLSIPE